MLAERWLQLRGQKEKFKAKESSRDWEQTEYSYVNEATNCDHYPFTDVFIKVDKYDLDYWDTVYRGMQGEMSHILF